jgi:hypothetical protein
MGETGGVEGVMRCCSSSRQSGFRISLCNLKSDVSIHPAMTIN